MFADSTGKADSLSDFFRRTQSKMYNLYEKYLASGCELEVPLADKTRAQYVERMRDVNAWLFESEEVENLYDMMHFADGSVPPALHLVQLKL